MKNIETLEIQVEKLIAAKKLKNSKKHSLVDQIIAEKEALAKYARKKRDSLKSKESTLEKSNTKRISKIKKIVTNVKKVKVDSFLSKKDLIIQLRNAKNSHIKQMSYINVLVQTDNFHEVKATFPVSFTDCKFGKWYYGAGQLFFEFEEFINIEKSHKKIHNLYIKIYNLYKVEIVGTILKSKKKQLKKRNKKIQAIWVKYQYQSDLFCKNIVLLEKTIKSLTDKQINLL